MMILLVSGEGTHQPIDLVYFFIAGIRIRVLLSENRANLDLMKLNHAHFQQFKGKICGPGKHSEIFGLEKLLTTTFVSGSRCF
jgi:hypothetical protein